MHQTHLSPSAFKVPVKKRYYRKSDAEDVYLNEGYIEIKAKNKKSAYDIVREMMDRTNKPVFQSTDPRIEWTTDWSEEHDDMVYEDWSFDIDE